MSRSDRKAPRFEVAWKARLSFDSGRDYCPVYQVSIHNASATGLRVITDHPFSEGQQLCIRMICKHSRKLTAFTLKGSVVYCTAFDPRMGYKLGLALQEAPDAYQQLIDTMEREGHPLYD